MTKPQKKAPELRFKGFTEDWEQRKLGEVVDVRSGKDYKHLSEGDIPVYGTGGYMLSVSEALSYEENAIGIGRKGTIDKPYLLKAPFWTVDTLFYAVPKDNNDLDFTHSIFQKVNWKQKDESTGVPSLSKTTINKVQVSIPNYEEQRKIGSFFQEFDHLITLHQRKYDALLKLKEAYLQNMFPAKGESLPKVRFANFEEKWEQRKLGDLSPLRGGFAFKSSKFSNSGVPIIRISNILSNGTIGGDFVHYNRQENDGNYLLPDKAAVLAMSGATTGKVSILENPNNEKFYQNQRVGYFEKTDYVDYSFISTLVRSKLFMKELNSVLIAGAQPNISSKDIDGFEFVVPLDIGEQQKIGGFCEGLDDLIIYQQENSKKTLQLKEAYLQKMFV